ncbi:MAG: flagellar assembly protein FliW [Pirellulales bacterium]
MEIHTTRFGTVGVNADDVILFPNGILGLEDCQQWVLLADAEDGALGWLQSTSRADVALAAVSPRRFVPDYDVRVPRSELAPLLLESIDEAHVLVVLSKSEHGITLNLKAPLVINLRRRLGRQVIHNADEPLQYELCELEPVRRIA